MVETAPVMVDVPCSSEDEAVKTSGTNDATVEPDVVLGTREREIWFEHFSLPSST